MLVNAMRAEQATAFIEPRGTRQAGLPIKSAATAKLDHLDRFGIERIASMPPRRPVESKIPAGSVIEKRRKL